MVVTYMVRNTLASRVKPTFHLKGKSKEQGGNRGRREQDTSEILTSRLSNHFLKGGNSNILTRSGTHPKTGINPGNVWNQTNMVCTARIALGYQAPKSSSSRKFQQFAYAYSVITSVAKALIAPWALNAFFLSLLSCSRSISSLERAEERISQNSKDLERTTVSRSRTERREKKGLRAERRARWASLDITVRITGVRTGPSMGP